MIKFKQHFYTDHFETKVNDWLQEQEGINIKHVVPFDGGVGIFYEDPKSFTKTVREKSTGR